MYLCRLLARDNVKGANEEILLEKMFLYLINLSIIYIGLTINKL